MKAAMTRIFDGIYIVDGANALFIKKLNAVVVGDMHIGLERKYERMGVHFEHASEADASSIMKVCKEVGARTVISLGDVKESIGFPDVFELQALRRFFAGIGDYDIIIAKGNHDGHLPEILQRIGVNTQIEREILLGDFVFTHGNSMLSHDALSKKYAIAAHGHFVVRQGARLEKAFMVARRVSTSKIENRSQKLILVPAFSKLIYGTQITDSTKKMMPMFRNMVFDFDSAQVIGAQGDRLGSAGLVAKEQGIV